MKTEISKESGGGMNEVEMVESIVAKLKLRPEVSHCIWACT